MSRIKQSISWWCFAHGGMTPRQLLRAAADIGYAAVELVELAGAPVMVGGGGGVVWIVQMYVAGVLTFPAVSSAFTPKLWRAVLSEL